MRIRRRKLASGRGNRLIAKSLTLLAVLLIAVAAVDMRLRPIIEDVVSYQAQGAAFRLINNAVVQALEETDIAYNDLVHLTRAQDGTVRSVQTDVVAVNRLKSQVSSCVVEQLNLPEQQALAIPLGTLLDIHMASGRGPMVEVELLPVGYVNSQLYNQFSSAGINQTLHQVMLETTVQLAAVLPGYTVHTETSSNFCIAETVIIGDIPDSYTTVGEDNRSTLSKLNDYRADIE